MRIGVLALQGDFAAHAAVLTRLGAQVVELRHVGELDSIDGLVLPGGESTALLRLMNGEPWFDGLRRFHERGGAIFATCAGLILIARQVRDPEQESVGLLDLVVRRNAWGRQVDSFETTVPLTGDETPLSAVFIRAPRLAELGASVEVLGSLAGEPVVVEQGTILAATFHPELTGDVRLHRRFLATAARASAAIAL